MKIFLIGFMACGKTTIGKWAARRAEIDFIDLDQWIEESEGRTISQIFEEEGEDVFRKIEYHALLRVIALPGDRIISCGGGTPCFFDNMEWINAAGTSIYLRHGVNTLTGRLKNAKADRPLLKDEKLLKEFVQIGLDTRESFYFQAKIVLFERNASKKGVWKEIEKLLTNEENK